MVKKIIPLLFLAFFNLQKNASAQNWAIHLNGNTTYPINNDLKGQHPILWYSSEDDRGILVGGFGLGVSYQKPWEEKSFLKILLNAQRSRFYDMPSIYYDENGAPLGAIIGINTNLNTSLLGMPVFSITENKKWLVGTGIGIRGTFYSKSDYGEAFVQGEKTSLKLKNKSLSPVHIFLPLEMTKNFGAGYLINFPFCILLCELQSPHLHHSFHT